MIFWCLSFQLDQETKLLEGEHRDQMNQLQAEQERITEMKRRQQETLAAALREREKVGVFFSSSLHFPNKNFARVSICNPSPSHLQRERYF